MLRENLKDAGVIVDNILTQPLDIPGATRNISLLEAAKNFDPENTENSDLRKILLNLIKYPEETQTMLRELELLLNDLK